jgi:DNA repair exonuclease SbcCD nuclease subunit
MKFVHIADMHFDSPFVNISDKENFGDLRRLEQRNVFKKVIEYIKENNIKYLFISGDLYEQKYIKKSTIEFINNLFKKIEDTYVFITPGNHDPIIKNSYYNQFKWNKNVKIFNSKIEKIETEDADIYGYGFDDFYCKNSEIDDIKIDNKNNINILISHGTLDAGREENREYNPISSKKIEEKGFDYIALGHIHKISYKDKENQNIVYPGSTISLGFDELGEHGMIVGNVEKGNINLEFVALDEEEFIEIELDITKINSKEELIEKINSLEIEENKYVKIILIGNRQFEINNYEIIKLISNERIIKIKDKTKISYDIEKIANSNTLRGLFAKEMLEKLNEEISDERKEIIEKAIEIGLESLE